MPLKKLSFFLAIVQITVIVMRWLTDRVAHIIKSNNLP